VLFNVPALNSGASGQATITLRLNDPLSAGPAFLTNTARLTAQGIPSATLAQDVDFVGTLPDLNLTVAYTPTLLAPNKRMTYTLQYSNTGRMEALNAAITVTLTPSMSYMNGGWTPLGGNVYSYPVGTLPAGTGGPTVTLVISYANQPQIGAPEIDLPFRISTPTRDGNDATPVNNLTYAAIGVPDLIVTQFTVEPRIPQANRPVTFTITVKNQGNGMAWNPNNQGGTWVDVFIAPVDSYPWQRYSEKNIFAQVPPLASGVERPIVIRYSQGFSEQELSQIQAFYAKVDNHSENPYGLVPEADEFNNVQVFTPRPYRIYIPLVLRNQK
jgi:hypothetical protein